MYARHGRYHGPALLLRFFDTSLLCLSRLSTVPPTDPRYGHSRRFCSLSISVSAMANVRSMLRSERAARRINHPQAQYTSTGALVCKACRTQLKSDSLWQSHISSSQHVSALKNLASGLMGQASAKGTKRKAGDGDDDFEEESTRKRAKAEVVVPTRDTSISGTEPATDPSKAESITEPPVVTAVNEDEWAAFEREMAEPAPADNMAAKTDIMAGATISAAPVTAAELAAKSREEQSMQAKERREAEMEGEKEDAQRRLEEEFDEMEELEARVQRLKEKREALRRKTHSPANQSMSPVPELEPTKSSDESEDSEDDDWDDWGAP